MKRNVCLMMCAVLSAVVSSLSHITIVSDFTGGDVRPLDKISFQQTRV